MTYLLIDPPVSPLSPRAKIQEWVEELARRAEDPQYSDPNVRRQIQHAIAEALDWLAAAQDGSPVALPGSSTQDVEG